MTDRVASLPTERQFLKTKELAEMIGLDPITLYRMRRQGVGPAFVRFGRGIRYPRAGVEAFIADSMQVPVAA